jgi:hypothetical protein
VLIGWSNPRGAIFIRYATRVEFVHACSVCLVFKPSHNVHSGL